MIIGHFVLREYEDWRVKYYFAVTRYYANDILQDLESIGCDDMTLQRAYYNLKTGNLDTGLTYSNFETRESIVVVGLTSSGAEFFNSLTHESKHLERHISKALGIDPYGEEACYLAGVIAMKMYKDAKLLICDDCRRKMAK